MNTDREIEELQRTDPIGVAEDLVGGLLGALDGKKRQVSYKDHNKIDPSDPESPTVNQVVMGLSFGLMRAKRERSDALAEATNDTMFSNDLERYIGIVEDLGFEKCMEIDLPAPKRGIFSENRDKFFIFACEKDGLILSFDTYNSNRVNSGNLYFNHLTYGPERWPRQVSDGTLSMYDPETNSALVRVSHEVWMEHISKDENPTVRVGSVDCREWLRKNVNELRKYQLLPRWARSPFLWFLGYTEHKCPECGEDEYRCPCDPKFSYSHREITRSRIEMSPVLQRIVNGKYEED